MYLLILALTFLPTIWLIGLMVYFSGITKKKKRRSKKVKPYRSYKATPKRYKSSIIDDIIIDTAID